ncbi:Cyclin-D1-2 [Acorus gramineus]|uniref:Cyclin-D1-2 n=1 Tax=Acorus gramineus TaxID=55184 RepID=A0AAV9BIN1_ACOGR|nr:Cyclin-D1-2 [Acorus gramineus]
MEEQRVTSLSEFWMEGDYCFEGSMIRRMELLVLNTLGWRMRSVTPFDYLAYFASKFGCKAKALLCKEAAELLLITIQDMNLMDYRPSEIAAAAILAASDEKLTEKLLELKMGVIPSIGSIEIEHVISCYNTMQELYMRKNKMPKALISSDSSSPTCASNNNSTIDAASLTTKRRLASNGHDCEFRISKKNRLD